MKRKILIILILIWMILIFTSSSQNATVSSDLSGSVIETVAKTLPSTKELNETELNNLIGELQHIVRKSAHFFLYMTGAILFFMLYSTYNINKKKICIYSLCSTVIYAITDEIHQLFISGRGAQVQDVILDGCGALTGIGIMLLLIKCLKIINGKIILFKTKNRMLEENKKNQEKSTSNINGGI